MEYQRASAATAFSKKLSNGHSFNGKNMYDGVFGGQTKIGSRVEDYAEIFGGGSGSSIPVLDVPELSERKFSVDVSSSKLDYSNIFSGFGDLDFGVSHEEFIAKPTRDRKTPAKTRSYSEGSFSYPSNIPMGNQVLSNDLISHESGNAVKQFKMSYNRSIPGSKNGTNGTTHVAKLHAVPAYSSLIDEQVTPSSDRPVSPVVNETNQNNNSGKGMEGIHKKLASNVPRSGVSKQTLESGDGLPSKSRSFGSDFNDVLFGSCDVAHTTPPTKVSRAASMSNNIGSNERDSMKFGVSRCHSLDGDAGVSSPPYFDDEVDANSVAATSAAAVKKAIEEAQARLKIAKELMERRKEGHVTPIKPSSNGGLKGQKRKKGKDTLKENNVRQDKAQETCEKVDASVQTSAQTPPRVRKQNVIKVGRMVPESEDSEKFFTTREAAVGTYEKNFVLSQPDCRQEFAGKKEVAKEGEREKEVMQALNECEREEKKIIEKPEKDGEKSHVVEEAHEEKVERKLDASKELYDKIECLNKLKSDAESYDHKEDETKLRFAEQCEETQEVSSELDTCDRTLKEPEKPTEDGRKVEMQELKDIDNMETQKDARGIDNVETNSHILKPEENGSGLEDVSEKEDNKMLLPDASLQEEFEKRSEEAFEMSELIEEWKEACGAEENKEEEEGANNREDNEQMLNELVKPEIIGLRHSDFDKEERQRRLEEKGDFLGNEEFMEAKDNGDMFEDTYQMEPAEEQKEAPEGVGTEEMQKQTDQKADEITQAREDVLGCFEEEKGDLLGNEEFMEAKENGDMFEDAYQMEPVEDEQKDAPGSVGTEEMQKQTDQKADEITQVREDVLGCFEGEKGDLLGNEEFMEAKGNGDTFEDAYQMEPAEDEQEDAPESVRTEEMQKQTDQKADEITQARENVLGCFEEDREAANDANEENNINNFGETMEPSKREDSCQMTPELLVNEENDRIVDGSKNDIEGKDTRRDSDAVEVANDSEENMAFDKAGLAESNSKFNEIEQKLENAAEAYDSDRYSTDTDTTDTSFEHKQYEQNSKESEIICTMETHVQELVYESEVDIREAKVVLKQEGNKYKFEFPEEGRWVDSQLDSNFGEKHDTTERAHESESSPSAENHEENHLDILTKEGRETKNNFQEVEPVKKQQRRVDEAKEREREREKERIAVERAIREARERAFAEARERAAAGRKNVEARQKVKAEAQGEFAKPSAEAVDKSFMEAKLKAERAAVERATAEARQRALEKALSENAAFGTRNLAEKVSNAKQNFQSYDSRYKGSSPATGRYPNSSNQSGSNLSEGLNGATGESAQRCKARLERHQRTSERAAKALAEKNKRDILAQKEQAERNRLAETLDAEVKRWSSGKQGNLRALLSTLQYILGPDSGWQPIPLTDMIATGAVKKAYRKATLCVHPDKLQQRGASIQQKYTCEKVFDLLKEAWNKFSAEER